MPTRPSITIYTDGGCAPNPGPGGWGVVLIPDNGAPKELSGAEPDTTNNRMELTAAVQALRVLDQPSDVTMVTDSQYLRQGITEWLPGWVKRNWISSTKQPVKNQDLWQALHAETQRHTITWKWVRGHAGNQYNEMVDQLATAARERLTGKPTTPPPVDFTPEYEIALRVSAGKSGGWAARIASTDTSAPFQTFTGRETSASGNQLELTAALKALKQVSPGVAVRVYCPSDYLYNGMTGWVSGWQKRGWITSSGTPVKHRDLWEALIAEAETRPIQWALEKGQSPAIARGLDKLAADAGRTS